MDTQKKTSFVLTTTPAEVAQCMKYQSTVPCNVGRYEIIGTSSKNCLVENQRQNTWIISMIIAVIVLLSHAYYMFLIWNEIPVTVEEARFRRQRINREMTIFIVVCLAVIIFLGDMRKCIVGPAIFKLILGLFVANWFIPLLWPISFPSTPTVR